MMPILLLAPLQIPAGGVAVVAPEGLALQGKAEYGTVERVPVEGQAFASAVRVTTFRAAPNEWEFEVGTDATVAVRKGDVLFAQVWVRALKGQPETGEGRTTLDFQTKGPAWSKSVSHPFAITKDWRRIDVPFVAGYDTSAGGANVAFRLGYGPQTVEIGGLSIVDLGPTADVSKLPRTETHYRGEEADAPWRRAALARIERIRKGPLVVRVVDARGRPVVGARVEARMTRQAFAFGTAVAADALLAKGDDADRYRATLLAGFNRATIENNLKWDLWENGGRTDGLAAVDWLDAHGLTVRAHNVLWPSWRNSPKDLAGLTPVALRDRIDGRIADVVRAVKGKVAVWDVVNEPYDNHDFFDRLAVSPVAAMAEWFEGVRSVDPKPILVLNDYPPLDGAAPGNLHLDDFYRNLAGLKAAGAPIGGLGFQCHIGGDPVPPERVLSGLDRFARLGLPIEITEFDIDTQERDYQARYMRDFLIAAYSHPSVTGFTQWGFVASHHWLPDAALYGSDWSLRPHGKAYLNLVRRAWWTDARGSAAKDGAYRTRGYYGDYAVTVRASGHPAKTVGMRLSRGGKPFLVRL